MMKGQSTGGYFLGVQKEGTIDPTANSIVGVSGNMLLGKHI
jgi:hypothetical protein